MVGADRLLAVSRLRARIEDHSARIGVVGLGYVGIPVAVSFAAAGFHVTGLDTDARRAAALGRGELPVASNEPGLVALLQAGLSSRHFSATTDVRQLAAHDVYVIAVDTPIDDRHRANTRDLEAACRSVAEICGEPSAVVIESTLAPGTMRAVVAPLFERRADVFLLYCPERVRPGRLLRNLRTLPRLVGVDDPSVGTVGTALYGHIVQADLAVSSWEAAEVVKAAENAARDVQIGLANQLAVVCDYTGVDFRWVREQINRLWSSEPLILDAGAGVGGHCLPKDPWLLISRLPERAPVSLIEGARQQNDRMPEHVVELVLRALRGASADPPSAKVVVLGLTYEADSDDQRHAAGPRIVSVLQGAVGTVMSHDPFVAPGDLRQAFAGADAAVVVVGHSAYRTAEHGALGAVMRHRVIIDCRRVLDADVMRTLGFDYRGLGLGSLKTPPT